MPEQTQTQSPAAESVEEKPCSSSAAAAANDDGAEVLEEAKKLLGTGNRHLVMGDVVSAVAVFQDACSLLAERFGDTAYECGEALFLCGKSLLELARMENTVLGNALEGVPEEDEEEDQEEQPNSKIESANNLDADTREELRKQVYEAMAEEERTNSAANTSPPRKDSAGETTEGTEAKEEALETPAAAVEGDGEEEESMEDEGSDDDDDDDDEQGEKNGEEEEVGNLQLAWEMLEVAKVIYKRRESREDQLMAAQAHLKLGEVSAESGNYPQAVEDFQECLSLQLTHLPPHSRLLAETHYHVATSLCCMEQYDQALKHFQSALKVVEERLAMLQEAISKAGADSSSEDTSEMEELKLLLPALEEKVEDAKESQRTASAASRAIQQTLGGASTSSGFSENGASSSSAFGASSSGFGSSSSAFGASQISVKPAEGASSSVSNIAHLVRKKRKPDEDSGAVEDSAEKQTKRDKNESSSSNGVHGTQQEPSQSASSTETAA